MVPNEFAEVESAGVDASGGRTHPLRCSAIGVLSSASRRHETIEVANTSAGGHRRPLMRFAIFRRPRIVDLQPFKMAENKLAVFVAQVHAVAAAVAEPFAVGTFILAHPLAVTIRTELIFPDVHEIILVDISLVIIRSDARARGNRTVG